MTEAKIAPQGPPAEMPKLPEPHDPPVFGYTSADMKAYARKHAAAENARLREAGEKALRIFDWLERRSIYQDAEAKEAHNALRAALKGTP